jgi:uncharacterized membrane protein YbhN (UPF0104 family)
VPRCDNNTVPHHQSAGVNAENYFRCLFQRDVFVILRDHVLTPNKNIKLILNYVVGPLVFCILMYAIYIQLRQQNNWKESLVQIADALNGQSLGLMGISILLMFVNWGIEARKWQLALSPELKISFIHSLKAIFSGTTMAVFTPNRMGEYMGRILYVEEGKRISSIALTVVCSIAQLMVTLVMGVAGILYIKNRPGVIEGPGIFWINIMVCAVLGVIIVLTIFYFRLSWLVRWLEKIPRIEKYLTYIRVLYRFNATLLLRILSLSAVRYLVFVAQYYLLFSVFKVEIDWWQTFWSVSVVFLIIAIVPSIALLTELGVRWEASMEVVRVFSSNSAGILAASLFVWLINLVVPALIGSLLIAGVKIFRK